MRRYWIGILLVGLIGCSSDHRRKLVIYSPHGKELLSTYEQAFEAVHPEVDVQWLDMGSQQVYDRIRTERNNPQASLWWGAPSPMFVRAAREGLLEPYRPTWADAVPPEAQGKDDTWYGTYLTPEVIIFNHDLLSREEAPRDWDDLLDPRWEGEIILRNPLESGTMRTIFAAMILRQPSEAEGFLWLARLDRNTRTYAADPTQLYLKLARGEGVVSLWNMPDTYLQAERYGYPFSFVVPASGTPLLAEGIALVRGGPNLEDARMFYEFVTTREALIRQAREFYRIPARQDIPRDSLPSWMTSQTIRVLPIDLDVLVEQGPRWMQYWAEHIRGRGEAYLREHGVTALP